MNPYPRLIAFTVLMLLGAATVRAACPVTLSLGEIDADGRLSATVTTNGNCGTSAVSVAVDGVGAGFQQCSGPLCTQTFKIDTACWGAAPRQIQAFGQCRNLRPADSFCEPQSGQSGPQSKTVNNRPTVNLIMPPVNALWRTTATVTAHFQTRARGSQYLRLVRNGNINDVVAQVYYENGEQDVTWTPTVDLTCQKGPQTFQAVAMTCGAGGRVVGGNPIPADPSLIEWSAPAVLEIEATPTATLTIPEPGPTGQTIATVTGHFPYRLDRRRYVRLFRNGNINDVVAQQLPEDASHDLTFQVGLNFACTSGTTTYQAAAMICGAHFLVIGGNPVPSDPDFIGYSGEETMSDESDPDVSVSFSTSGGTDTGLITYSFPSTSSQNQRDLSVFVDDALVANLSMTAHSGTHPVVLGNCWKKLRAVATSCDQSGNPAFTDEAELKNPHPKPTVELTLRRLGIDPQTHRRIIEVRTKYNLQQPSGRVRVRLQKWKDADGHEHGSSIVLRDLNPPQNTSDTDAFLYIPSSAAQQIGFLAIVDGCETVKDFKWIDCSVCDQGGASKNPVYYNDGNMRLTDTDPLPPIAGQRLTRTYNSDEQVVGLFGRGWTTLFDRRLVTDDDAVSLSTATNEVVTFRQVGGDLVQTWPTAAPAMGTLVHDAAAGTYTWRAPGDSDTAVFRASDGRLLALRDLTSGHEVQIGYDAAGSPQALIDSWSGVSWTLTLSQGRVASIGVSGRPDIVWSYLYDASGNLTSVAVPGGTWRTYEYTANRMTASRDALGNLIESHSYDANGYAISSTGNVDEIALLEYGLPGAIPEEIVTRVTYKTGATSELALRPIGGAYRTVRSTAGCAGCGTGEATYVRDEDGNVIREQGADGYVTATAYADGRVQTEERALVPTGCDPRTDAQHCRLGTDALATAVLQPTGATGRMAYEYHDPLWPDRVTAMTRSSVAAPGQTRREAYVYHPVTGAIVSATVCGFSGANLACGERSTFTTFYEGSGAALAPAFDPGGVFQSAWMALPQPAFLPKSIDGPRDDAQDISSIVYYPIDPSVPSLLRGQLAATKNAVGHITRYEAYDVFGNVTRVVDPNGVATEMTFDALGRLVTSTTRGVAGCSTVDDPLCATDLTATRAYSSGAGPLRLDQRPGGGTTVYAYDARGRLQTVSRGPAENDLRERIETTYDSLTGKKSLERILANEAGTWVEKRRQSFAYDSHARMQTVTHADGAAVHYTYDPEDRIATVRDENHAAPNTTYTYDPEGRVATIKQTLAGAPGGLITTSYTYDTDGNLTAVTDPNDNITSYVYDDFSQLISQESPVTGTTAYAYDSAGNLTQMTDARGATTTRVYDALNRVTSTTSTISPPKSEVVSWSYDDPATGRFAIGRLASMTDPSGSTAYRYERRGLVRDETRTLNGAQYTYTTAFQYDSDGNRAVVKYPSTQLTVQYGFDYAGRPISASNLVTTASYLPFGPLKMLSFGNNTIQTISYDARYRVTSNSLGVNGQNALAQYTYGHDASGNITSILDATDSGYDRTFLYDDLNRLITANTGAALWRRGSFTWDAMGNMLSMKLGEIEKGPTDPLDAVRHQRDRLRTEENVPLGRSSSFTYSGTTPRLLEVMTNDLSRPVGYDPAGNETSYIATRNYSLRNLLAEVIDPGEPGEPLQHKLTYTYDGRGIRVIRAESPADGPDTAARRFSIYTPELQLLAVTRDDASNIWALSANDKNIHYEIVWFAGRPIAQVTPGGSSLYTFTDHLNTPILQTDTTATVTWRAEHEPFGNVYEMRTGKRTDQPLRFPGQELAMNWEGQEENYNIFRWHRSGWGRYTQVDPIKRNPPYLYANANPVGASDPLGLYVYKPDITWADDAVLGAWTDLPTKVNASYDCVDCKLTVTMKVKLAVHLPPISEIGPTKYYCSMVAELNHLTIFDYWIHKALNVVIPYEKKKYPSQEACWQGAKAADNTLINKMQTIYLGHTLSQILEEIRHNSYNPCPFYGTP